MLADQRLDVAFNLTLAPAHGPITRSALEAGLHVFSEKPIASTVAEGDRLIELAQGRDRKR
jgi:predicted dehydrogenase